MMDMTPDFPIGSPEYMAQDVGPLLLATSSVFIVLSTVFVGLRYYARYLSQTKFGAEDVIMPFAWLSLIGLCITGIVMVKKAGTGRHIQYVDATYPFMAMQHFKGLMITEILHLPAVAFPKLCVAITYLRIFTDKWARIATWAVIVTIVATWFSYMVATMLQCLPFDYNWDKSVPDGKCFNLALFGTSGSVPNVATDLVVLLLPIKTIIDLKISIGRRIGLLLIFLTGSIGIVASIIRTVVYASINPLTDPTYCHVDLINWTIIEPGLYLIAACALSFKPLFRMLARALHLDHMVTHDTNSASRPASRAKSSDAGSGDYAKKIRSSLTGFQRLKSPRPSSVKSVSASMKDLDFGCQGEVETEKEVRAGPTTVPGTEGKKSVDRYSSGSYDYV